MSIDVHGLSELHDIARDLNYPPWHPQQHPAVSLRGEPASQGLRASRAFCTMARLRPLLSLPPWEVSSMDVSNDRTLSSLSLQHRS